MPHRESFKTALALIFQGIDLLKAKFPSKEFTIDGRLVGDIGEVIASIDYDLSLYEAQTPDHDGVTSDGLKVQVKATFKDKLTMTAIPDYYLGLQLSDDGTYREVFNGPGSVIAAHFKHRKGIGEKQLSFSIHTLKQLSETIDPSQKVPKRAA